METKALAALVAVGLAAAIAIPSIALGNARRNLGTLHAPQARETPYVATLTGPSGIGSAAVSFDLTATAPQVCWDLSYSGISPPTLAHIHRGGAAIVGPIVVPFAPLGSTSASGCDVVDLALATEIINNPADFYVNVHTIELPAGAIRGQLAKGPAPTGETHLLPVPLRVYDSREGGGGTIAALETRTISLATGKDQQGVSATAVPPGATAAVVTLTVTETTVGVGGNGGFLKLYSAVGPEPATSSINWGGADQIVAVTTHVAVDDVGQVKVTAGANATHFVIDVIGYLY